MPGSKGNTNAFKHGAYAILYMRAKTDRPDEETPLGKFFRNIEDEYLRDLGGKENASLAMRTLVNDSAWCDLLVATMDFQLQRKRQLTRKGKPHPIIELRMKVAAHRRENYKLLGLQRVVKETTWEDFKRELEKDDEPEEPK